MRVQIDYLFLSNDRKEALLFLRQLESKGFVNIHDLKVLSYLGFPIHETIEYFSFEQISFENLHNSLEKISKNEKYLELRRKNLKIKEKQEALYNLYSSIINLIYVKLFLKYVKNMLTYMKL